MGHEVQQLPEAETKAKPEASQLHRARTDDDSAGCQESKQARERSSETAFRLFLQIRRAGVAAPLLCLAVHAGCY